MKKLIPNGFGMIEVLITILILSAGALFLVRFQIVSTSSMTEASERSEAVQIAKSRLDGIRKVINTEFNLSTPTDFKATKLSIQGKTTTFNSYIDIGTITCPIGPCGTFNNLNINDVIPIQSTTTWVDKTGQTQYAVLVTSITKPAAPWPSSLCRWDSSNTTDYLRGIFILPTTGTDVWLCTSTNCGQGTGKEPKAGDWKKVGSFNGTAITGATCKPPNLNGSPK
nr:prepilin-type N-terminal cleavage/methylation domain-containing protein [uncultured Deefgea sp.]